MYDLGAILAEAAAGRLPAPDGSVDVLASPLGPSDAVLGFSAHAIIAADGIDPDEVRARLDPDDFGASVRAPFLAWLGDRLGAKVGILDATLVAMGGSAGAPPLALEPLGVHHPRVERAHRYRSDVAAYVTADGSGVVVVGRGLARRWETAFEVEPTARGFGLGRKLATAALSLVPPGEPLFCQVAPGNAASLRAVLAAGYRPIGSEVLFLRR